MAAGVTEGAGWAVGSLDAMGDGYGFRKVRQHLGVTAFGVNAIVLPPNYTADAHFHDDQEELYVCLEGELSLEFGADFADRQVLQPGDIARVDPATVRRMGNPGETDCTYLCIGGKDGYVGRDGRRPDEPPDSTQ